MSKRPDSKFVLFDVTYADGTRRSNRKVPSGLLGALTATNRLAPRSPSRISALPKRRASLCR
jgi:hypothetical protein